VAGACLAYVLRQALAQADQIRASDYQPGWLTLLAVPCVMLGQLAVGSITFLLLRLLGARAGWVAVVRIHLMAQVAKYLPIGGVLNVAAQANGLARLPEVGTARAVGVLPLSLGTILASAVTWFGVTALLGAAYPWWVAAVAVPALPVFWGLLYSRRLWQSRPARLLAKYVSRNTLVEAVALHLGARFLLLPIGLAAWILFGSSLVLIAGQFAPVEARAAIRIAGAMAASWVLGFLSFVVPAGLGVREAAMMTLLEPLVPPPGPVLIPLVSRLVCMMADLLNLLVAVALLRPLSRLRARGL